ncbi:hypothetical protein [Catenuloplanes japonicus]|uniref:hypothetical protein n=1 Tax=Catenuloplanes japonicus TaxID=33876 RepID=UPI000527D222|nr:hypothetical protein [Catenuloplanes japonicus]
MHAYYVTYTFTGPRGGGGGAVDITRPQPIRTANDIYGVAEFIRDRNNFDTVVVQNWIEIEPA